MYDDIAWLSGGTTAPRIVHTTLRVNNIRRQGENTTSECTKCNEKNVCAKKSKCLDGCCRSPCHDGSDPLSEPNTCQYSVECPLLYRCENGVCCPQFSAPGATTSCFFQPLQHPRSAVVHSFYNALRANSFADGLLSILQQRLSMSARETGLNETSTPNATTSVYPDYSALLNNYGDYSDYTATPTSSYDITDWLMLNDSASTTTTEVLCWNGRRPLPIDCHGDSNKCPPEHRCMRNRCCAMRKI